MNKHKKLYIVLAIFAFFIYVVFVLFQTKSSPSPQEQKNTNENTSITEKRILYETADIEKMLDLVKNRQILDNTDQTLKETLISLVNNQSDVLDETPLFRIEYIKTPDVFLVGIKVAETEGAKAQAVLWFTSRGFTKNSLCKLPVIFYVTRSAAENRQNTETFTHLPDGC